MLFLQSVMLLMLLKIHHNDFELLQILLQTGTPLKQKLYLVDISSFIFRAYYGVRPLTTSAGVAVNAVFGVVTMLNKLIGQNRPDHLVICADHPQKGFRHKIYPAYKANRSSPPEDLVPQFDLVWEFIRAYPLPVLSVEGYEADDIIATLVHQYKHTPNIEIIIVSSDKDLMQLVDNNVCLYDTMKEKIIREKEVHEKFGVLPTQVIDVQSLCGDSSDNIPGIAGVGPKTATKLIQDFGSLDGVFENVEKIPGKLGEKIAQGKDSAFISKQLVTLVTDMPLQLDWESLALQVPNQKDLNEFYKKVEFKSMITPTTSGDLFATQHATAKVNPAEFILINQESQLVAIVEDMLSQNITLLAFDTETDSLNTQQAHLVGFSFCYENTKAYYVPFRHVSAENFSLDAFRKIFSPILTHPGIAKLAQNAKFDLNILVNHGLIISPLKHDTLMSSYLLDPDGKHGLDYLAEKHLQHAMIKYTDIVPKDKTFADVPLDLAVNYAAEDAWATFCIHQKLISQLEQQNLQELYDTVEIPLINVLADMERHGVLLDPLMLLELKKEFQQRLAVLQENIFRLAGGEFNINSPKQLAEILFEKLKLPLQKKTKTGYSTDVEVLKQLAKNHDLPLLLLDFRSVSKLLSTYVEGLSAVMNQNTHRVHTHFNQTIAATGRLSSTEPNLQNIPIKTEEGRRIRHVFIAPPGYELLSADYSQIELRLLAAFSQDKNLVEAYQNNQDIHAKTAAHIFGIPLEQVSTKHRHIGKTINFGVVYGQSAFGLAQQLEVPQGEAAHFINSFYKEFSGVKDYREKVIAQAEQDGFVTTFLGRKRWFSDINSKNKMKKQMAERMAFNTVFQGSAADLIKKAMILIHQQLQEKSLHTKMILQVHDELLFEVPQNERDQVQQLVIQIMENAFQLNVPLQVSSCFGKNWAEAH